MEIQELATQLGQAIKKDERILNLEKARQNYYTNAELQNALKEYEVQQRALQQEAGKPDKDSLLMTSIQTRIDQLYKQITTTPVFVELDRIQAEVNELMNEVNDIIMFNITGEHPCTHDCSSCGGDCGHHH